VWCCVCLTLGAAVAAPGTSASEDAGRLSLDLVNDAWSTGQDEGFSARFRLVLRTAPFIGDGFSDLLPQRWPIVAEYWSVGAQFDIYTPTDLSADTVEELIDDRPYAGYLSGIFGSELVFHDSPFIDDGYSLVATSFELGWVGPGTGAGTFQREWHEWLRNLLNRNVTPREPRGWGVYEVPNALLVSFRARYETEAFKWRRFHPRRYQRKGSELQTQLTGFLDCSLGTLRVSCEYGTLFRAGWMPDIALEGLLPVSFWNDARSGGRPRSPLSAYVFVGVGGDVVAYNAFLDGPPGTDSPTIEKRLAGAKGQIGFLVRWRSFEFFYRHMVLTREVRTVPLDGVNPQQLGQFILSAAWD
jgi:hypothetical protein